MFEIRDIPQESVIWLRLKISVPKLFFKNFQNVICEGKIKARSINGFFIYHRSPDLSFGPGTSDENKSRLGDEIGNPRVTTRVSDSRSDKVLVRMIIVSPFHLISNLHSNEA